MPSAALTHWQVDRMHRLALMESHCISLHVPVGAAVAAASSLAFAQESLQAFVMLLSGHFQGFCRDLYTECSQLCAAAVPASLLTTVQAQFAAELKLNTTNPTVESIRRDFERFGFLLDLAGAAPGNPLRVTHLGHLNYWRNTVAHQKATPPPSGVPATLTLPDVQARRSSCDGLAFCLDDIMRKELTRILGNAPW
jgi:hypothetical protein